MESIGLIEELHEWGSEDVASGEPQPFDDGACGAGAHHDFQGDDLDFFGEEALLVEGADVVSGDILGGEQFEEFYRDLGGEGAFAGDGFSLFAVAGGDGVGEAHDDRMGVLGGEDLFSFALVEELHSVLYDSRGKWERQLCCGIAERIWRWRGISKKLVRRDSSAI